MGVETGPTYGGQHRTLSSADYVQKAALRSSLVRVSEAPISKFSEPELLKPNLLYGSLLHGASSLECRATGPTDSSTVRPAVATANFESSIHAKSFACCSALSSETGGVSTNSTLTMTENRLLLSRTVESQHPSRSLALASSHEPSAARRVPAATSLAPGFGVQPTDALRQTAVTNKLLATSSHVLHGDSSAQCIKNRFLDAGLTVSDKRVSGPSTSLLSGRLLQSSCLPTSCRSEGALKSTLLSTAGHLLHNNLLLQSGITTTSNAALSTSGCSLQKTALSLTAGSAETYHGLSTITTSPLLAGSLVSDRRLPSDGLFSKRVCGDALESQPLASGAAVVAVKNAHLRDETAETSKHHMASRKRKDTSEGHQLPEYHIDLGDESDVNDIGYYAYPPIKKKKSFDNDGAADTESNVKKELVNCVCASLLRSPDFKQAKDATRLKLVQLCRSVSVFDPEFILKLALYTRTELNIRATTNFLLAYAAYDVQCRPYLARYFSATVQLPSDWIEVAEIYQAFQDNHLSFGSLPVALRKAMVAKFKDFDEYQLAKYNKEKSRLKKQKKAKAESGKAPTQEQASAKHEDASASSDSSEDEGDNNETTDRDGAVSGAESDHDQKVREQKLFTLKQLIRQLHIHEPVYSVMCLLGKRYPSSREDFYKSRLPGLWDEAKAGKRMKLAIPETWETQVSLKGNRAPVWQELIDKKKLPFMAMLRNLRNMLLAGISEHHHQWVLGKLTDEQSVINSKQFPFRFFSAYEVLNALETDYDHLEKYQEEYSQLCVKLGESTKANAKEAHHEKSKGAAAARRRTATVRTRGQVATVRTHGKASAEIQRLEKNINRLLRYNLNLLQRYRTALDTAVRISTVHNVDPIEGRTLVLCKIGSSMFKPCTAARGLGAPRQVVEVAILLALMCKYSCEQCTLIAYTSTSHVSVELEKGTILKNVESIMAYAKVYHQDAFDAKDVEKRGSQIANVLTKYVVNREQLDNLILLRDGEDCGDQEALDDFLCKYRHLVNPDLLHVTINLSEKVLGVDSSKHVTHPNDVYVSGYSDQILRFVAKRADGQGQLQHIESIDKRNKLPIHEKIKHVVAANDVPGVECPQPDKPLALHYVKPRWRSARVFISSTFRDMHGERDLLTRFVIPEIRRRAAEHYINVFDVDLRWGVTEQDTRGEQMLGICLNETNQCQFFVGLLGERYGWRPPHYTLPPGSLSKWIQSMPPGLSITELEMRLALGSSTKHCFFFIRDPSFMKSIPKKYREDFFPEDAEARSRISDLKHMIRKSANELYDGYPCTWIGAVGGIPMTGGLEELGKRIMTQLWRSIRESFPDEEILVDEFSHEKAQQDAVIENYCIKFSGRTQLLESCMEAIKAAYTKVPSPSVTGSSGVRFGSLVILSGPAGCGLSSIMAKLSHECQKPECQPVEHLLVHVVGATPGSTNLGVMLRRFCHELSIGLSKEDTDVDDFRSLVVNFHALLAEAASRSPRASVAVVVDGLEKFDDAHMERSLSWIPTHIPQNVSIVVSTKDGSSIHTRLELLKQPAAKQNVYSFKVPPLAVSEKRLIVKANLAFYGKALSESPFNNQLQTLTSKKDAGNVTYLSVACEELRLHGAFEKLSEKIQGLPQLLPALIESVLTRLESDIGYGGLLHAAFGFLLCSKDGLVEADLLALLSYWQLHSDLPVDVIFETTRRTVLKGEDYLAPTLFARVTTAFRALIKTVESNESGSYHYSLPHEAFVQAIKEKYKMTQTNAIPFRRILAGHLFNEADCARDNTWKGRSVSAFADLPGQLALGNCYEDLIRVLTDLRYLAARFHMGLSSSLVQDYSLVDCSNGNEFLPIRIHAEKHVNSASNATNLHRVTSGFDDFKSFISRSIHILTLSPAAILQLALNEPVSSAVAKQAATLLGSWVKHDGGDIALAVGISRPVGVLEWLTKPQVEGACYRTVAFQRDAILSGADASVMTAVATSPDGTLVATGARNGSIRVFNATTAEELQEFDGHSLSVTKLCFVTGGRLCSSSSDGTLSLWNISSGYRIAIMNGHTRSVSGCTSDSTGKVIVSVGRDCCIKLWNGHSLKLITQLTREKCPLNAVAFHPEGQQIAVGCWDATIKIWDTFSKARKAIIRGHRSSVKDVTFSPDGKYIASASLDGEVKLWAADKGIPIGNFIGHRFFVTSLTFSTSGLTLFTASADHKVKLWSAPLGQLSVHHVQAEHGAATAVMLEPSATYLLSGHADGTVVVYDLITEAITGKRQVHTGAVRRICPCSTMREVNAFEFITCSEDGTLLANTYRRGDVMGSWTVAIIHLESPTSTGSVLSISCAGVLLASTSSDSRIRVHLWQKPNLEARLLTGHVGAVTCCCFNSDASRLATGGRDCSVIVWDTEAASQLKIKDSSLLKEVEIIKLHTIQGCHADWVNDLAWSSDANYLVTASNDFNLKLWDTSNYEERQTFKGHTAAVNCVSYAHGCIVSGSSDGQLKVWTHRGSEVTTLRLERPARVNSCSILFTRKSHSQRHDDDERDENPAAGSDDFYPESQQQPSSWAARVELSEWWAAHKSQLPASASGSVPRKAGTASAAQSTPTRMYGNDQLMVACAAEDGAVKLWQPLVGHQLDTYDGHSDRVLALACFPTAHQPADRAMVCCSCSLDGTLKMWGRRLTGNGALNVSAEEANDSGSRQGPLEQQHHGELVFCIAQPSPAFIVTASREDATMCLYLIENDSVSYVSKVALDHQPTCACFYGPCMFATAGTDGCTTTLTRWKIAFDVESKKHIMIASSRQILSSPVSTIASDMNNWIYAGTWDARLLVVNVSDKGACSSEDVERSRCEGLRAGRWPTIMVPLNDNMLFVVGSESLLMTATGPWHKQPMLKQFTVDPQPYLDDFGRPAWFTATAVVSSSVWIGDSKGQLTILTRKSVHAAAILDPRQMIRKIHGAAISAIAAVGAHVLTASYDMTVKIWTSDLQQVGEFHHGSPITALHVISDTSGLFVIGDRMGSVNVLKWLQI